MVSDGRRQEELVSVHAGHRAAVTVFVKRATEGIEPLVEADASEVRTMQLLQSTLQEKFDLLSRLDGEILKLSEDGE